MNPASTAPVSAPTVVATSRNIPTRTFVNPSRTYAAAAPDEVAITDTSEAPIAYLRSMWKRSVIIGTTTSPPPSPVSAPSSPAPKEPRARNNASSKMLNVSPLVCSGSQPLLDFPRPPECDHGSARNCDRKYATGIVPIPMNFW